MRFVRRYLIPRLIQYLLVTWTGITVVFFIPRLLPGDPVIRRVDTILAWGTYMEPAAIQDMVRTLREMYGLEAGLFSQYLSFWRRLFTGDFGPSLEMFPVPVIELIGRAVPWTVGLLFTTMVLTFIVGNIVGGLSGYFSRSSIMKTVDGMVMMVRPIPYYIFALLVMILLAYILPIFPVGGGITIGMAVALTWRSIVDVARHGFLPALSLIMLGSAATHQTMRLLVQGVKEEAYVKYAKIGNVSERTIFSRYIMRNAMLPQITAFGLTLGMLFGGALITEIVFGYPGLGMLAFRAIIAADYNLLLGMTTLSVLLLTTSILLIDFLYPLFDPRIRLQ